MLAAIVATGSSLWVRELRAQATSCSTGRISACRISTCRISTIGNSEASGWSPAHGRHGALQNSEAWICLVAA
jgi:hypothetical protein